MTLEEEISELVQTIRPLPECQHLIPLLEAFAEIYRQASRQYQFPMITAHGDYTPANMMITLANSLCVLDWEHSRTPDNPLLDVGAFSLSLLQRSAKRGVFQQKLNSQAPVYWFFREYSQQLQLPVFLSPTYYILRLISRILHSSPDDTIIYNALSTRIPLLQSALEYSVALGRQSQGAIFN